MMFVIFLHLQSGMTKWERDQAPILADVLLLDPNAPMHLPLSNQSQGRLRTTAPPSSSTPHVAPVRIASNSLSSVVANKQPHKQRGGLALDAFYAGVRLNLTYLRVSLRIETSWLKLVYEKLSFLHDFLKKRGQIGSNWFACPTLFDFALTDYSYSNQLCVVLNVAYRLNCSCILPGIAFPIS